MKPTIQLDKSYVEKTNNPEEGFEDEDELLMDTLKHQDNVKECMNAIALYLEEIGEYHDWTKLEYFEEFKKDVIERQDTPDFKQREWYKIHTREERHHINARVPDKVNLFDVLEMIVDCIIAGKSRTGKVNNNFLVLPQTVLNEAYWNTVKLIEESIKIKE